MADYGIRIRNISTGSIQIDQNYSNLELIKIMTVTTVGDVALGNGAGTVGNTSYRSGFSGFRLLMPSDIPFNSFVFAVGSYHICERSPSFSGGRVFTTNAPVGTNITLYIFAYPVTSSTLDNAYGVRVRKADGTIAFHSSRQYLNIPAVYVGTYNPVSPPSATLPSGRTYAVCNFKWSGRREIDFDRFWTPGGIAVYDINERGLMVRVVDNVVDTVEGYYMNGEFGSINYIPTGERYDVEDLNYGIMVADVTYFVNP